MKSLHLSAKHPFVKLQAESAKNKQGAEKFLTKSLAARLKEYTNTKPSADPLFLVTDLVRLAVILRTDCEDAREAWISSIERDSKEQLRREQTDFLLPTNHEGDVLDFHCLRHTCGAWLALRGIHPKAIQRVMRHSTITITLDTYGHLFPEQEDAAITALEKASGD